MEFNFPDDRWLIETQEISQQVLRTRSNFHCLLFHETNHKNERVAVPIYHELYDLFDEVTERKDDFENVDEDIITAVKRGIKKTKIREVS